MEEIILGAEYPNLRVELDDRVNWGTESSVRLPWSAIGGTSAIKGAPFKPPNLLMLGEAARLRWRSSMRILIAYGTSEGQTRKIAKAVAARLNELGHDAHLFDTASPETMHVESYDKIIIAGSVHQQRHQESVEVFVVAGLAELQTKPTLFLSVSLSAAFPDGLAEAQRYVDDFLVITGWKPTRSLLIAGALRYEEYDYFKAQIIEHVVLKGRRVEGPNGDFEFTDWESLSRAVDSFARA
jgi:menaquinone-dependent protoporphyrinogen oxidase